MLKRNDIFKLLIKCQNLFKRIQMKQKISFFAKLLGNNKMTMLNEINGSAICVQYSTQYVCVI